MYGEGLNFSVNWFMSSCVCVCGSFLILSRNEKLRMKSATHDRLWPGRLYPKIGIGQTEQILSRPLARPNRTMARPMTRPSARPLCRPLPGPNSFLAGSLSRTSPRVSCKPEFLSDQTFQTQVTSDPTFQTQRVSDQTFQTERVLIRPPSEHGPDSNSDHCPDLNHTIIRL